MVTMLILVGSLGLVVAGVTSWLHSKLRARYDFSIMSWPFVLLVISLLILPTLVYIAYIPDCQHLERFHYVGIYLLLAAGGIPLAVFNIRRTNGILGFAATVWQLTIMMAALSIGLIPPTAHDVMRPVDGYGRLKYCGRISDGHLMDTQKAGTLVGYTMASGLPGKSDVA
jgi:hypothetical protein